MKPIDISKKTKGEIVELFRTNNDFNIVTSKGFITLTGGFKDGILSKVENTKESLFVGKRWVEV